RPEIGPKTEVRLPDDVVTTIDADAARQHISRAEWLRRAALHYLPHRALDPRHLVTDALIETDTWLADTREWALDPDESAGERAARGAAYAQCVSQMRDAIRQARDSIRVQELSEEYAQAPADDRAEWGRRWGRASGADMAAKILDALLLTLPLDGTRVETRSRLDDPLMDLGD